MILDAKSFSRTDPERKPRDQVGFCSPHFAACKKIWKFYAILRQLEGKININSKL